MLKNKNIICISSIDWDFIWQGHQEIMSTLARNGNRILFIENTGVRMPGIRDISRIKNRIHNWFSGVRGIRQEEENLYIFSPLVLPFPYLRIAQWINRRLVVSVLQKWIKIMDFNDPIVWLFLPTPLSLNIIKDLNNKAVVYYCIDNFRVSSVAANKIRHSEIKLLKTADLVFVTSKELYDYCSRFNDRVHIFPFAVNFKDFAKARQESGAMPEELKGIKRPIIGYVGGVHKWIDRDLVKSMAQKYPGYSFVFVGPIQSGISSLSEFKNIYFLGKKDHSRIPYFINAFDACIIPYLAAEYTKNVYPTKLNEYLAMGKPVVSTGLPEVIYFNKENGNLVSIGKTREEFASLVAGVLSQTQDELIYERVAAAKRNSWDVRIDQMSSLIEDAVDRKSRMRPDWRESLLRFYKASRTKMLKAIIFSLSIYFLVFYTPLIWFLAEPLKISEIPQKADAIVVFAGGVGESGRAGQGYQERVDYAVKLYKQGYASHLIFYSGYKFIFNEAEIMKSLAIILGVPSEAIILEEKSGKTYQYVESVKEISNKMHWNKILLISSPYHLRRVSLVFNKLTRNINVIYTPIPNSFYYSHPNRNEYGKKVWRTANIQQIKGIVHEYLGLLYYWWKGWL